MPAESHAKALKREVCYLGPKIESTILQQDSRFFVADFAPSRLCARSPSKVGITKGLRDVLAALSAIDRWRAAHL
jgi:hypothetical protein